MAKSFDPIASQIAWKFYRPALERKSSSSIYFKCEPYCQQASYFTFSAPRNLWKSRIFFSFLRSGKTAQEIYRYVHKVSRAYIHCSKLEVQMEKKLERMKLQISLKLFFLLPFCSIFLTTNLLLEELFFFSMRSLSTAGFAFKKNEKWSKFSSLEISL